MAALATRGIRIDPRSSQNIVLAKEVNLKNTMFPRREPTEATRTTWKSVINFVSVSTIIYWTRDDVECNGLSKY